jgi:hypothetical protein
MRFLVILFLSALASAQVAEQIKTEAMEHSQVVPVFEMFTVTIGPRLTASPAHKRAAEYARDRLAPTASPTRIWSRGISAGAGRSKSSPLK